MKQCHLFLTALLWMCFSVANGQGLPPLGSSPDQKAPVPAAAPAPPSALSVDAANADLKLARAANLEKRFADAETLMLRDTTARPNMPYLWIELGQSQLGLKKYLEAETSFKAAMSGGESVQKQAPSGGFYSADKGTVAHVSVSKSASSPDRTDHGEIQGICLSSLGEVYVRTNRIPEAAAAFDDAAKAFPAQAPLYLRNGTILFLQTGHAPEQVATATKAIAVDPTRAALYFYKGQGLASQATIDPKTQKLVLPPGCVEALQKYLDLEPGGPYSADAKGMLTAAGVPLKPVKK